MARPPVVTLLLVLAMVGCATGYHPKGLGGGYSEIQLNARTFQVHFVGNGYTNSTAAEQGAMHRAAELTIDRGFFGFWVSNQGTQVATSAYTPPLNCTTLGTYTSCNGGNTQIIQRPDSTLTINMVTWQEAQMPPPGIVVYDARLILSQMAQ